ncbi:hypothetical protein ACH4NU_37985 [Streptomyces sp. NPDC017259]|uniref:AbiJ-related protein n=1 Tax=Streptomyces sp. NPDC017259 TaxID=3364991 RepID=UPI00379E8F3B
MDLVRLRSLLEGVLITLYQRYTGAELPGVCERISLPPPPDDSSITKHERLSVSLSACPDNRLPLVAEAVLKHEGLVAWQSMPLEDVLWVGRHYIEVPARTRRELAKELDLSDYLRYPDRFLAMLGSLWDLGENDFEVWGPHLGTLHDDIQRHVIRFPGDWSTEHLFEQLGAFDAVHPRFARFLEALVSPSTLPDESAQRRVVELANRHLAALGAELRQEGEEDGYPLFALIQSRSGTTRRPRNLIFATLGKPDIRLSSALDNDIEVAERADEFLVYDRPVGKDGLLWRDLLAWWQETRKDANATRASRSLYQRMANSLPEESKGQHNLFWIYHHIYQDQLHEVPALLPEIWLHWDPKTKHERQQLAMKNLRMDFLLLLPGNRRVVLEVDGIQHYTRDRGSTPDAARYAETMAGDRDLKLRGYEVFRFGHSELQHKGAAQPLLSNFFSRLLQRSPDNQP